MKIALAISLLLSMSLWLPALQDRHEEPKQATPLENAAKEGRINLNKERRAAAGIEVAGVETRTLPELVQTTGTLEVNADRVAHLASRLPGVALEVSGQGFLGVRVREGDALAVVHSIEFGKAQVDFRKSLQVLKLRQKSFDREKGLFEKKISSGREFVEAEADLEQARIDLEAAQNQLEILGLGKEDLEAVSSGSAPLGRMPLRAPISGVVIEKHLVKGEHVDSESSLFTIADLDALWMLADIYERDLARVAIGQTAEVACAAWPGVTFRGKISHLAEVMNVDTRTLKVRIEVENKDGKLKPGMFDSVTISVGERLNVLAIPEAAVQTYRQQSIVFVEESTDEFIRRRVRTGVRFGGFVEILEGLDAGVKVVTSGSFLLKSELEKASFEAD